MIRKMKKVLKNVFSWIGLGLLAIVVFPAMIIHTAYQVWFWKKSILDTGGRPEKLLDENCDD